MEFLEFFSIYLSTPLYFFYIFLCKNFKNYYNIKDSESLRKILLYHNYLMIFNSCLLLFISLDTTYWLIKNCDNCSYLEILVSEIRFAFPRFYFYVIIFQVCKLMEWIDTAFLIFREKKTLFLHLFHHGTICLSFYAGQFSASLLWISVINSLIHIIMYSYYAKIKIFLPLAKYITRFQIIQLLGSFFLEIYTILNPINSKFLFYNMLSFLTATVYFISFINYYIARYLKKIR